MSENTALGNTALGNTALGNTAPGNAALANAYRRLLWAYPRFYRRDRGLEMLTTLMDMAGPDQTRASLADAAHLIRSGVRLRLVPPGWAGKIAATVVTLWTAIVLAGTAAAIAWQVTAEPVDLGGSPLAALSDSLVGQAPDRVSPSEPEILTAATAYVATGDLQTFADEGWDGPAPVPMGAHRFYAGTQSAAVLLPQAYQRLQADGWATGSIEDGVFWAMRDGLMLRLQGDGDAMTVGLYQTEPDGVLGIAIAGFVLGALAVWPIATWLTHRCARVPRRARAAIVLFGLPGLAACVANTVDVVMSMVPDPTAPSRMIGADLLYPLAGQIADPRAAVVIAASLVAVLGIVATAARWGAPRTAERPA